MAKRVAIDENLTELKDALTKEYLLGSQVALKNLKLGKIEKIFLASNCKEEFREEVDNLAKFSKVKIINMKQPNDELGIICKKPFSISVISLVK